MKSKELFPGIFSRHAEAYQRRLESIMRRKEARGRERVLEAIAAQPGMRVLDLACGPGTLSLRIAAQVRPGGCVVGIDLARGMVQRAHEARLANADFAVMDMEQLGFVDGSFDAATCGHGLQFVPDLGLTLRETRRVLGADDVFAASIPVAPRQDPVSAELGDVIDRWLAPAPQAIDRELTRMTVSDASALMRAALDAGFADASVEVIDESIRWESAEQLVALTASWWDIAARLERTDPARRESFMKEAVNALRAKHSGPLETSGRSHVLIART